MILIVCIKLRISSSPFYENLNTVFIQATRIRNHIRTPLSPYFQGRGLNYFLEKSCPSYVAVHILYYQGLRGWRNV